MSNDTAMVVEVICVAGLSLISATIALTPRFSFLMTCSSGVQI